MRADDHWYRRNPPLQRLLQVQVGARRRDRRMRLLRDAARWHETRGEAEVAVAYALQRGDLDLASEVISEAWGPLIARGQDRVVEELLSAVPEDYVERDPRLLVVRAWLAARLGDWVLTQRSLGEAIRIDRSEGFPGGLTVEAGAAVIRSLYPFHGSHAMRIQGEKAVELLDPGSPWVPVARMGLALSAYLEGSQEEAVATIHSILGAGAEPGIRVGMLAFEALIYMDRGEPEDAAARAVAAEALMPEASEGTWYEALLDTARGELALSRGEVDEGLELLERGAEAPRRWHSVEHMESLVRLVSAMQRHGSAEEAVGPANEVRAIGVAWGGREGGRYLRRIDRQPARGLVSEITPRSRWESAPVRISTEPSERPA